MTTPDPFESLREALRVSPDNIPLRLHLADSLTQRGMFEESEVEYREALKLDPDNDDIKMKLAKVYMQQSKATHALVIVEEMMSRSESPPAAYVMHARLLLNAGDVERAVRLYKEGVDLDPDVADEDLANQLGIDADEGEELVDGRLRATWEGSDDGRDVDIQRPRLTFADVGGMDDLKDEIQMKIIHPLKHPELYEAYGKKLSLIHI